MSENAKDEALKRLREALPYILCGIKEIKTDHPNTTTVLSLAAQNSDGSGKMILTVNEPEELFNAIALALDITVTQNDEMAHRAAQFVAKWGLRS